MGAIQQEWTYMDPYRRKFHIGLYHGQDSGHVLVYINGKIIIIDFEIKEQKQYSFYLGPELFNLDLQPDEKGFVYTVLKDNESPTPLNLARIRDEKEDKQLIGIGFGILSLAILVLFILS